MTNKQPSEHDSKPVLVSGVKYNDCDVRKTRKISRSELLKVEDKSVEKSWYVLQLQVNYEYLFVTSDYSNT